MTLAQGSWLGPYEILSPLGAGGMGEVDRARDPRLSREVAIKVLPASYSRDPDRTPVRAEAKAAGVLILAVRSHQVELEENSDIEVERELPWVRAQPDRIHFVLAFVVNPGLDQVPREDASFQKELVVLLEGV